MTLLAIAACGKSIVAIVAGTARFPLIHVFHCKVLYPCLIRENFSMAVLAGVNPGMEFVAEGRSIYSLGLEGNLSGGHSLVTVAAVAGHGKSLGTIMAGATCLAFLHLCHSDPTVFAGDDLAVMTASALAASCSEMNGVAESGFRCTFYFVGDVTGFAFMTAGAGFFIGNTEGFYPRMAGTARFCFFHFSHGKVLTLL